MEQSTAYILVILSPIIAWSLKMRISYKIRYETTRKNINNFFKKNKTPFLKRYFYTDLKSLIPSSLYITNFLLGLLLISLVAISFIYFLLFTFGRTLKFLIIPKSIFYLDLVLASILMITGIIDWAEEKISKK